MVFALNELLKKLRLGRDARREAELRALVTDAIAECYDSTGQAERLVRWERRLNQWSARDRWRAAKAR